MKEKIDVIVVSLFDGLSGGRIALDRTPHLNVLRYYSSEIDKYAIQIADKNYPKDTDYRLGSVTEVCGNKLKESITSEFPNTKIMLIGGSPCTGFSMAGKLKGSCTKDGIDVTSLEQYLDLKEKGFEFDGQSYLFWEYIRIKEELQPDYFMLENVRVTKKWKPMFDGAMGVEPTRINSSLVSAQNRDRYYWHNFGYIPQPEDKGLILKDTLALDTFNDPIIEQRPRGFNQGGNKALDGKTPTLSKSSWHENNFLKERPERSKNDIIQLNVPTFSQQRVYGTGGKSPIIAAGNKGGGKEPSKIILEGIKPSVAKNIVGQHEEIKAGKNGFYQLKCESGFQDNKVGITKSPTLRSGDNCTYIQERPCELKEFNKNSTCHHVANATDIKGNESIKRVYAESGKSPAMTTCQGGHREPKVLINESVGRDGKSYCITSRYAGAVAWNSCERKQRTMVTVEESFDEDPNTYKGVRYRKLIPLECERLQTLPDNYTEGVSNSQRYKMIGNGWTIDVIAHIFSFIK